MGYLGRCVWILGMICCIISANESSSISESQALQANPTQTSNQECDEVCQVIQKQIKATQIKNGKFVSVSFAGVFMDTNEGMSIIPTAGIKAGAISFFNPYVGVRGYFGFDMGFGKHSGILAMVSLGIDALAEFPLTKSHKAFLGGMLGIGVDGYLYYDKVEFNSFSNMRKRGEIYMQGGLTFALFTHNRINVIYRFLPSTRASNFSAQGLVMAEYIYKF